MLNIPNRSLISKKQIALNLLQAKNYMSKTYEEILNRTPNRLA
jgi:hypothetical protein